MQDVPCDQLDRAVCHASAEARDMEFWEAFDHAMHALSPEDRQIAALVAEHGMAHAARDMGVSWRQIDNALARMRAVFEVAGFDAPTRAVPHHTTQ
jgi:DNA-directed RNA polymerase specialized sigma24 family protein